MGHQSNDVLGNSGGGTNKKKGKERPTPLVESPERARGIRCGACYIQLEKKNITSYYCKTCFANFLDFVHRNFQRSDFFVFASGLSSGVASAVPFHVLSRVDTSVKEPRRPKDALARKPNPRDSARHLVCVAVSRAVSGPC